MAGGVAEDRVGAVRDRVGDQALLHHAEHEAQEARREVVEVGFRQGPQLRLHLMILEDRPGEQLGEEENVEQVGSEVRRRAAQPAAGVHEVGDLLEHDEGDADRQQDLRDNQGWHVQSGEQCVQIGDEEARVLVMDQDAEVGEDAGGEQQAREPGAGPARDGAGEGVIERRGGEHDRDEERLRPEIEKEAGEEDDAAARPGPPLGDEVC